MKIIDAVVQQSYTVVTSPVIPPMSEPRSQFPYGMKNFRPNSSMVPHQGNLSEYLNIAQMCKCKSNAFRTFNAWDFLFTLKFFWFVLRNDKTSLTSCGLSRLFDVWSKVKPNFLGTKSPRLWNKKFMKHNPGHPYNLAVFLLLSHLRKEAFQCSECTFCN